MAQDGLLLAEAARAEGLSLNRSLSVAPSPALALRGPLYYNVMREAWRG